MASSGLSRRRVGGTSSMDGDDDGTSPAPTTPPTPTGTERRKQAGGNAFEGGDRVAFDARDMDLSDEAREGGKMPRLTIMEEVLLIGLKDRAVRSCIAFVLFHSTRRSRSAFPVWIPSVITFRVPQQRLRIPTHTTRRS
jgi:hypothetical protein